MGVSGARFPGYLRESRGVFAACGLASVCQAASGKNPSIVGDGGLDRHGQRRGLLISLDEELLAELARLRELALEGQHLCRCRCRGQFAVERDAVALALDGDDAKRLLAAD